MPLNLLKIYNQLLEIAALSVVKRTESLKAIFKRDIENNDKFKFRNKQIKPTVTDGEIPMETLFKHLTTIKFDYETQKREFDFHRSVRIHWIKYHIEGKKTDNVLIFSVKEPEGNRTYIYDKDENYVIVLEPLRKTSEYYLLTAYPILGKDDKREKMLKKYKKRLPEVL